MKYRSVMWISMLWLNLVGVLALAQAQTQTPEFLQARSMAASCTSCHSEKAGQMSLAGINRDTLLQKLQAFKAGTRPASVMHQISRGYSDAQLLAIATYFSAQKK